MRIGVHFFQRNFITGGLRSFHPLSRLAIVAVIAKTNYTIVNFFSRGCSSAHRRCIKSSLLPSCIAPVSSTNPGAEQSTGKENDWKRGTVDRGAIIFWLHVFGSKLTLTIVISSGDNDPDFTRDELIVLQVNIRPDNLSLSLFLFRKLPSFASPFSARCCFLLHSFNYTREYKYGEFVPITLLIIRIPPTKLLVAS